MRVIGVDVTSAPSSSKPLALAFGWLAGDRVHLEHLQTAESFAVVETALAAPGPWIMAMDSCFGLPAGLVARLGWPPSWQAYVAEAAALDRTAYRDLLVADQAAQPAGQKYLYRQNDRVARSASPCNVRRPPMGLMFHALAPRLQAAEGVSVLPLRPVPGANRLVVEAYPALVARALLADPAYKDGPRDQQARRLTNREVLLTGLQGAAVAAAYGVRLEALPGDLAADLVAERSADRLDALLALIQAAWAWRQEGHGMPDTPTIRQEGWIADPAMAAPPVAPRP